MLFKFIVVVYRPPAIKEARAGERAVTELLHTTGTLAFLKAASMAGLRAGLAESPSVRLEPVTMECRGFKFH